MSPALIRPLLHSIHLVTFAVLLVTGLLLFVPGLRGLVTGGYSLWIRDGHRWAGVAFAALPLLVLLRFGPRSVAAQPERWNARALWKALHVFVTFALGLVFTATGVVLWVKDRLSESIVDTSLSIHDALTYLAIALVAAHLLEIGLAAVVQRFKAAAASS